MAAICASQECVLLTNGETAAVIHFRSSDQIEFLELPVSNNKSLADVVSEKDQKVTKKQDKKHEGDRQKRQKENITEQAQKKDSEERTKSDNHILACALSSDGHLIAVCDDRKFLHVYKVEDGRCHIQFSSPLVHRCTSVTVSKDNQHVIVADKSGDAYVFNVMEQVKGQVSKNSTDEASLSEVQTTPVECQHEDRNKGGTLLLGHHSMLIDLLLVDSDTLIVTCDRDEKIRISHFPDGYNIQTFCLGHTQFVISLAYDDARKILMSGSGDATVRLWDLHGHELHQKNVLPDIPADDSLPSTEMNEAQTDNPMEVSVGRFQSQTTIQQISYCSDHQILFVVIYKCPHILAYKLTDAGDSCRLTTQLISVLKGQENVVSICVSYHVLWIVRQGVSRLIVSAYRIQSEEDTVELVPVLEDASNESVAVQTFSKQELLLEVPPTLLDLMPSLWKPTFQEDIKYENSVKRLKVESERDQDGKRHKR